MEKNQNLMTNKMMVAKDHYLWKWNDQRQSHDYKYGGGGGGVGFSSRSYDCSFCKREFRSAQALGGHMNVHRRDRAMLRQHTPPLPPHINILDLNFHPNPNPNFSASPSPNGCNKFLMGVGLSLEMGHSKEDLDLELRLGF